MSEWPEVARACGAGLRFWQTYRDQYRVDVRDLRWDRERVGMQIATLLNPYLPAQAWYLYQFGLALTMNQVRLVEALDKGEVGMPVHLRRW